jgi:hypothetical protein
MITPTPKIALEEHFMAPGFEEYFGRCIRRLSKKSSKRPLVGHQLSH